jgi:hypothetical protein
MVTSCAECDRTVSPGGGGWYRCGNCGHESLRDVSASVARDLYVHWCQFDAPDRVSEADLRDVAREAFRQGDLFAAVLAERQS